MGWKGESRRHSLARKGIKTSKSDGLFKKEKRILKNIPLTIDFNKNLGRYAIADETDKYKIINKLEKIVETNLLHLRRMKKTDSIHTYESDFDFDFRKKRVKIEANGLIERVNFIEKAIGTFGFNVELEISNRDVNEKGQLTYEFVIKDINYSYEKR